MTPMPQPSDPGFESLPSILCRRAQDPQDLWSLTFLESDRTSIGVHAFADKVFRLAAHIVSLSDIGEPVLLLYPRGIDFLIGFMACLAANRPAVPINPPRRNRLIERVDGIIADSGARLALTTAAMLADQAWWRDDDVPLARLRWQETDRLVTAELATRPPMRETAPAIAPNDTAFIQYTSGSTSAPKGVVVSHGNLIADLERMEAAWDIRPQSVMVSWLPAFHDLGLIFGLLQPLFSGCATVAMAPARFLQSPHLWLEAIRDFRGTHTAAPSFAYDACLRRITAEQRAKFDLSSLRMAMNAAEPIDPAVLSAFAVAFSGCGYRASVSCPAYGLAESTLAITANPVDEVPVLVYLNAAILEAEGRAEIMAEDAPGARVLVGCGRPLPDIGITIVDPARGTVLADGRVGEIWASGPTIAAGYWNNPAMSADIFGARIAGMADIPHLRTGDLGFLWQGELVVTGRLKDVIIIRGVNYYPQDLERAAFRSAPALRAECCAAFSLPATDGGMERVVIVQEVERVHRKDPPKPLFDAIRDAIWHGFDLAPAIIVLIEPGSIPRTSSGKIRRAATRAALLEAKLPVIAAWEQPSATSFPPAARPNADRSALRIWMVDWLAEHLTIPAHYIDADDSFASIGMDSVTAMAFSQALSAHLSRPLAQTLVWDHPSPNRVLAHVTTAETPAAASPRRSPAPSLGRDVDELLARLEDADTAGQQHD